MSKGFTRTVVANEIHVAKFENGGLVELPVIIVDKEVTSEEAIKIATKTYKGEQVIVTNTVINTPQKRRISLEDFMKHSEVIEEQTTIEEYEPTPEEEHQESAL